MDELTTRLGICTQGSITAEVWKDSTPEGDAFYRLLVSSTATDATVVFFWGDLADLIGVCGQISDKVFADQVEDIATRLGAFVA